MCRPPHFHQQESDKELADKRGELDRENASDQKSSLSAMLGKDPEQIKKEKVARLTAQIRDVRAFEQESSLLSLL